VGLTAAPTLQACLDRQVGQFQYVHWLENEKGEKRVATLSVRYTQATCLSPYRKGQKTKPFHVWLVEAREEPHPIGVKALHGRLLTSIPVNAPQVAKDIICYDTLCGLIERFHYVRKPIPSVEDLQVVSPQALQNAIVLQSWIAIQTCALSYENQNNPDKDLKSLGFETQDYEIAYQYLTQIKPNTLPHTDQPTIRDFIGLVALLGGSSLQKKELLG
jgi:hypothetical protein